MYSSQEQINKEDLKLMYQVLDEYSQKMDKLLGKDYSEKLFDLYYKIEEILDEGEFEDD